MSIEQLELYEQIKHTIGECNADGHVCDYDTGGTDKSRRKKAAALIHRQRLEAQREVLEELDEPIWELDRDGSGHFNIDDIRAVITERTEAIEAELEDAA